MKLKVNQGFSKTERADTLHRRKSKSSSASGIQRIAKQVYAAQDRVLIADMLT